MTLLWQGAVFLSEYFEQVIASDASKEQIENAQPRNNIRYEVFPAERTTLADDSVDLITIAQALHWFDLYDFYKEVKRVLRKEEDDTRGSNDSNGSSVLSPRGLTVLKK
ncbi:MAG: class I SAM-dependent methyltransferase [Thermoproteota archaeon]|nr:class I SAM-dependent methyltransferase [Thermoproteota archaeon]